MRHFIFQVKTAEITPLHYLKCPQDSKYEEVKEPDKKIQQLLLWAHKAGLLAVWGPRRFELTADASRKKLASQFPAFQETVKALSAVTMDEFIRDDHLLETLQTDLKHAIANPFSDYIILDGEGPISFDRFLRKAAPGRTYHIGGVVLTYRD